MLSDFLTLEIYFGHENAALYFEDLVKRYGRKTTEAAARAGDIKCAASCLNTRTRKIRVWLTEQGRQKAGINAERAAGF